MEKTKTLSQMASASAQRSVQKVRKLLMEGGMTREEAKLQTRHSYRTYKYGFINGMKAMKKIDIEKACEAYCKVCDTKDCEEYGCKHECDWLNNFKNTIIHNEEAE